MAERRRNGIGSRLQDERGFALAMAVFALVVLAAVVASGYFSASQEFQIGRGMRSVMTSFYAGEAGILKTLDEWNPAVYDGLQPGDSVMVGPYSFPGGGNFTAHVVRVGGVADSIKRYFYIEAVGRPPPPARGERRQAAIVRARFPDICCGATITSVENVVFGGGKDEVVTGFDTQPPGWPLASCMGVYSDSLPGVIRSPAGTVNDSTRVIGAPVNILEDPTLTPANIMNFGDLSYDDIVALADHSFPDGYVFYGTQPTVVGGTCDTSSPLNWGDPTDPSSPCFDHFPIIHAQGTIELSGNGVAQAIVLADDDFYISGGFDFFGILLVVDDIVLSGPAAIYGIAYTSDDVFFNGAKARFLYSGCAAERAVRLSKLARPRLLDSRAWVEIF